MLYKKYWVLSTLVLSLSLIACGSDDTETELETDKVPKKVKNVIVLINDGAGVGTWDATAYWQYGSREAMPYAKFEHYAMTTYPLNGSKKPTYNSQSLVNYDALQAWDLTPTGDIKLPFKGYSYLAKTPTDSAAAGTALASGVKTYNNAINYDNMGNPVEYITAIAKAEGKSTGVVTTVPFSHATPAAFGAQNISRSNYHAIAKQMLTEGKLDVIMGTGVPGYNVNGTACDKLQPKESTVGCRTKNMNKYISAEDWEKLSGGQYFAKNAKQPWKVIRNLSDFEALAKGSLSYDGPVFASPEISNTLQQARQAKITGKDSANPSGDAFVKTVPSLAIMAQGALQQLQKNKSGFFLMIEGGATDWAAHTSGCSPEWDYGPCKSEPQYGRLIEESADFNNAVAEVIRWVEKNSNWEETLVIVTTDHDNGMPMGKDAQSIPFQKVINNGTMVMPGISFRPTGDHSNALVPLWTKGARSDLFNNRIHGVDTNYSKYYGYNDGKYIDNTEVFRVTNAAIKGQTLENYKR